MKQVRVLFLSGVFLPTLALGGSARSALDTFLSETQTYRAKFEQTLIDEKGVHLEVSRGEMYLQRPGKFRWDYKAPYEQVIVGDGKRVWIYDKELEQVSVKDMKAGLETTPALLLGGQSSLDKEFTVSELGKADGLTWLRLRSRREDNQYSIVRLAFQDSELRVMELLDNFGQTTRIVFSAERKNETIDPGTFKFEPPPGVDVLDASEEL